MAAPKLGARTVNELDSKVAMTQSFDWTAGREGKGKAITQADSLAPLVLRSHKKLRGKARALI